MATITKKKSAYRLNSEKNDEKRKIRQKIYTSARWRRIRDAYLYEHPSCEECAKVGKLTPAIDVHHKVSFVDAVGPMQMNLAYDYNNLESVCKICHQRIHNGRRH